MTTETLRFVLSAKDDASNAVRGLGASMGGLGKAMQSVGKSMTMFATVPILSGMVLATKAAIEEEKEMALLAKAMRTNAGATSEQIAATEKWITKTQNATGIADGDLRPALAALLAVTKDTSKAQGLLGIAMDISAAKGKPLEAVAAALAKAQLGNVGALGRLGIATKDAEGKTLSFKEAMRGAVATYGGAAATAAGTTAGKMAILKAKIADLSESIGTQLIPFVTKAVDFIGKWAGKFNDLSPGAQRIIVIVAGLVAAIGPLTWAIGVLIPVVAGLGTVISVTGALMSALAVGGLPAFGAALYAALGPVGAIILGITAIVAVFVLLWTKCEWFRNFWIGLWDHIKAVAEAVWPVIKAVGGKIVDALQWAWDKVSAAVKAFWNWAGPFIKAAISAWWQGIKTNMALIRAVFDRVWPLIVAVVRGSISNIKTIIHGVGTVVAVVRAVWDKVHAAAGTVWGLIVKVVRLAIRGIKTEVDVVKDIVAVIAAVWKRVHDAADTAWGKITDIVGAAFGRIRDFANQIIGVINWVIDKVPGLGSVAHVPPFGGGGGRSSSTIGGGSPARGSVSTPAIMDNGGMGGPGDESGGSGKGGGGTHSGGILGWLGELWDKFNIGALLPKPSGGMFGGATNALLGMGKDAIVGLLKKFGGGKGQQIVDFAKSMLGVPYLWGGTSPAGFDCSGLLYWAYQQAGVKDFPRIPTNGGRQIGRGAIRPADIMFYYPGAIQHGVRVPFGHFKMYAGGNQTIESTSGGVQMRPADWGGCAQIRTYLGLGGITRGPSICGEVGTEAVIPLTNPIRGAAVMREAGLVGGGDTYLTMEFNGPVYATSPAQARAAGNNIGIGIITKLATAKRATSRGTP